MKRLMEVHIFGQTFTVTSEDDEQYVREIASFVDQRMRQITESAKVTVPFRVAIMAALSIADELAKSGQQESSQQETQLIQEAELISSRLLERLEKAESHASETTVDNTLNSHSAG
ncbi:MAG: cell division protein ZapA [Desulfurellaceae bacterium]|nr:cell division protein ZapA [Desulfurellaceae bacterium]